MAANFALRGCVCSKVVATELAKVSVAAAVANLEANAVSNVHMGRLSSEEFVQAWRGERVFARLQVLHVFAH